MKRFLMGLFLFSMVASISLAEERKPAPDFALPHHNNPKDTLRLSDLKGKVVILDFWATWCRPCRMEIPGFIELYKTYKDSGFVMVGIALDQKSKVEKFYKSHKMNYPVVIGDRAISKAYGGITGIPTTFVLDKEGRIYKKYVGYRPLSLFKKDVETLLKEPYKGREEEKVETEGKD